MSQYLLGIDNGNTVCKAVLFDLTGREVGVASGQVATHYPHPGWSERSMAEVWQVTATVVREVLAAANVPGSAVVAVGNTGHGNGLYLLDRQGNPLRGVQSLDSRAGQLCADWNRAGLFEQTYPLTRQAFWAAQTNTLLAWHKQHEAALYAQIGSVLLCKDYINYCLTGQRSTDYTDMSATNLMDVANRTYSDALLSLYDLADIRDALPPLRHSHEVMGYVTAQAAIQTGLRAGTPVVAGMLDADASMVGSGVLEAGQVALVAGTWSVNGAVTNHPLYNPDLAMSAIFAVPDRWLALEASATSVTNLEWFIREFCVHERLEADRRGVSIHVVCDEQVAAHTFSEGSPIVFHPFLHGSNVQATARAGFYGIGGWHSRADMLRALYEGIVFSHLDHVEQLRQGGVATFEVARLTGGGSRSPVLSQLFADALDLPIEVPACPETGALGVALAAGIGAGIWSDYRQATTATVRVQQTYRPEPARTAIYLARYRAYKELIQTMKPCWDKLAAH